MKFLITPLFTSLACLISVNVIGQINDVDTILLEQYQIVYSNLYLQPLTVNYNVLCPDTLEEECTNLYFTNKISNQKNIVTSKASDYNDIWQKGHMAPKASLDCNCDLAKETYTYLNCALQAKKLNEPASSPWRQLELKERKIASQGKSVNVRIDVSFSKDSLPLYLNGPTIPSGFYKTLIVNGDALNYFFPNITPESNDLEHYKID